MRRQAAVIGAGISGLVTAYRLTQLGFRVTVFERQAVAGGLAAPVAVAGANIDRHFHFICPSDTAYIELLHELALSARLKWRPTRMGVFRNGDYHRFGTPGSLLTFSPLPVPDRVRFGLAAMRSRLRTHWTDLDAMSASEWLIADQGARCYDTIWRPLLEHKFGDTADDVSAAWMWARINRVANSRRGVLMREHLGYVEGGTAVVIDELVARIMGAGGSVRLRTAVESIVTEEGRIVGVRTEREQASFDVVVSTVATPLFLQLASGLPEEYSAALRGISYYDVVNWVLVTKTPLGTDFWLNIDDPSIPLPGVITYTHLDPMPQLQGLHVHYVPLYMPEGDRRWGVSFDEGLPRVLAALDRIRPGFSADLVDSYVSKDRYAQPLYNVGFDSAHGAVLTPGTPVAGLFRTDMSQVYPNDRSIVNAVEQAGLVAGTVGAWLAQ